MPVMSAVERTFCRNPLWGAAAARLVLPRAVRGARLGGDVLEIGAGAGSMAGELARRFGDIRLTVTDLDPVMVGSARRRLGDRATVTAADATALPFAHGSFDVVLSFLMLHHVVRWEDALGEVARVLRPGGTLVGYDLLDTAPSRFVHAVDRSPVRLIRHDAFAPALAAAGLEPTRVTRALAGSLIRFTVTKPEGDAP
ncbi:MAG: class I SAM-dependent methyltransferase [Jatrophihabitans sp.]|nr:MAG: class I SAM-dependent methyltransferase [Jatrophihabitans sp.]